MDAAGASLSPFLPVGRKEEERNAFDLDGRLRAGPYFPIMRISREADCTSVTGTTTLPNVRSGLATFSAIAKLRESSSSLQNRGITVYIETYTSCQ